MNSRVPSVDLRRARQPRQFVLKEGDPIVNIQAEQALLGSLIFDNAGFADIDSSLAPEDFSEPFHGRLFKAVANLVRVGRLAEPIILKEFFRIDPAFHDLGGLSYLAQLVDMAPPRSAAGDYARMVMDGARRRQVMAICDEIAERAALDPDATGTTLLAELERDLLAVRSRKGEMALRPWSEVSRELVDGLDKPDTSKLIQCGLRKIDQATGGFELGELVIIGGRPAMGKSALAGCMALNIARSYLDGVSPVPLGVVELNGEMTTMQMARRHLTDAAFTHYGEAAPYYRDIKRGILTNGQKEILRIVEEQLREIPLSMLKRTGITIGQGMAMLRRQKMLWDAMGIKLAAVVVDHVGLWRPDDAGRGRTEDQTIVSARLKEAADELECVMIGLAQLNRKVEERDDKRPQLPDLRDSGSWEQDADIVMGVYRDAYYARREREPKREPQLGEWVLRCASQEVEVPLLKMREGDPAVAKLWADIGRNALRDYNPESQAAMDFATMPLL